MGDEQVFEEDTERRSGRIDTDFVMIYVIGDLHLSLSTDKPMDKFGEEWKGHHEKIKTDWLEKVKDDDIVMLAGDTSWAMRYEEALVDFRWIDALPGKKLIIKGNHDYWWNYRSKISRECKSLFFVNSNCYQYGRYAIVGTRGWESPSAQDVENKKIYDRELLRLENSLKSVPQNRIVIGMIHYPPTSFGESTPFTDLFEKYGVEKVYYGHLHSKSAFQSAFVGEVNRIPYELISCDYTDFKLVVAAEGSAIEVDRTDFRCSARLLEERRKGIAMLETLSSFDKSRFVDLNYELAKKTAAQFVGREDSADSLGCFCSERFSDEELDEEVEWDLISVAERLGASEVQSISDGLIKYNFINALAKRQMSVAERFEFSNFSKCLALRKIVYRLYALKDEITLGLCRRLVSSDEKVEYYRIHLRSEHLSGKIYEISAIPSERIILHTTSEEVIHFMRTSGIEEEKMRQSRISDYVNVKMY